jgi:hypothetical protein
MKIDVAEIPSAFEVREELPRPNWEVISGWIDQNVPPEKLNEAWICVAREWLIQLKSHLPNEYEIVEGTEFLLLSAADAETNQRLLRHCHHYLRVILKLLDGVGGVEGFGKHVVLLFHDTGLFYTYVCDFDPESGEFGAAAGVFLEGGYGHVAIDAKTSFDLERTIVHELTHATLRHLPLPIWLNEGVTQVIEDLAIGRSNFWMNGDLAKQHREFWNADTIDAFWSGESFAFPDDGQMLSYSLAEVLFRNLSADFASESIEFVKRAHFSDAGAKALAETCGAKLSDRVAQFLGPGPWEPRREYPALDAEDKSTA